MKKSLRNKTPFALKLIAFGLHTNTAQLRRSDLKTYFILSSGRTGTNFLADHFNQYSSVTAVHEPKPYWQLRLWSHAFYAGKVNEDDQAKALYNLRRKSFSNLSSAIYLEANPALTGFANVIDDVYPGSEIIHVVRDPRNYIQSSLNQGTSMGLKGFMNRYIPYWYVDATSKIGARDNKDMTYRVANYWRVVNDNLLKLKRNNNYSSYKFEDVFDESFTGLRDIAKTLGLDFKEDKTQKKNQSKQRVKSSWEDWSDEEIKRVHEICSPTMQQFGYGEEPEWIKRSS